MMIINDDSRVINKLEASLTDDTRMVIYDRHMFIVQATALYLLAIQLKWLHYKKSEYAHIIFFVKLTIKL